MAFVYVEAGSYEITYCDEPSMQVQKGSVYIMPPNTPIKLVHYLDEEKGYFSCQWIYFNLFLDNTTDITGQIRLPHVLDEPLSALVGKKIRYLVDNFEPEIKSAKDAIAVQAVMFDLLQDLSGVLEINAGDSDADILAPALEYVNKNLSSFITIEELAALCNISVSYFYQRFKKTLGITPNRYILYKRHNKAAEMLMSTDDKFSVIARQTGFYDQFHFSREFSKHFGSSPSIYRKNCESKGFFGPYVDVSSGLEGRQ
jgi:AraC-like DNA-binding protein